MLRIRKKKLYGVARSIGELGDDARNLIERWKLQRDGIAPSAMVGDRIGELCAVVQRNIYLLVRRIGDGPGTALRVAFSNLSAAVSIPSGRRA